MNDFPFNNVHCKGDEIAKPTIQTKTPQSVEFNCCGSGVIGAVDSWGEGGS